MIKVLLFGGLGNHLFQIARAVDHKKRGSNVQVILIRKYKKTLYRFANFTLHESWLDEKKLLNYHQINSRDATIKEIILIGIFFLLNKINLYNNFDRKKSLFQKEHLKNGFDIGYFQSTEHVSKSSVEDICRSLLIKLEIESRKTISSYLVVHVRGGDFKENMRLEKKDIHNIYEISKSKNLRILVVTNDRQFALEIFSDLDFNFSNNANALEDFKTISRATNIYLSESTFSFWAAMCSTLLDSEAIAYADNYKFKQFFHDQIK